MYKRAQGFSKHLDFIVIDEIILQVAFILSVHIRNHHGAYATPAYRTMGIFLILIDALVLVLRNSMHNVITRGLYVEAAETVKHCFLVFAIAAVYMFAMQLGDVYSRIVLFLTLALHILLGYSSRVLWKAVLKKHSKGRENKNSMLVVVTPDLAQSLLKRLSGYDLTDYQIVGVVLTEETNLKSIEGYSIVTDLDSAADYIVREWIDSVYIDAPLTDEKIGKLMDDCSLMAVPTHYRLPSMGRDGVKRFVDKVGGTAVLTTSINYISPLQMLLKRGFDIVIGVFGSLVALIIIAVVAPIIKKESPGPVLFRQERIGKNGRHFQVFKIRSMYLDAEERKEDLSGQNRFKDGMMFKLDYDPRIIGNKILPDGTKKTGVGEFLRRTSLDEFPQFFNVVLGQMSVVGTRPPTVDEYNRYRYHHRARLAIKPGITGMWQVSGRSDITDFEEVVRLDTEYIANWSPGLDMKIMLKTFGVLFSQKGAM